MILPLIEFAVPMVCKLAPPKTDKGVNVELGFKLSAFEMACE